MNPRPPPPQDLSVTLPSIPDTASNPQPPGSGFLPTLSVAFEEASSLFWLAFPYFIMVFLLYSRSFVSMFFLGSLGELALPAGSLALAFANFTGYGVLYGLSLGMDPLCSQAFGAGRPKMLSLILQRCILILLCCSIAISGLLWMTMSKIYLWLGQNPEITSLAQRYLRFSLPDLLTCSLVYPLSSYLRAQKIIWPLAFAATLAAALHIPANFILVTRLGLGVPGVAVASAGSNLVFLLFLLAFMGCTGVHRSTWQQPTRDVFRGWVPLLRLAGPSSASVCLRWLWYLIAILLCGRLPDPKPAAAAMGVLIQTTSFLYLLPSSLSLAVSTWVGNQVGAARVSRARAAAFVSCLVSAVMGLLAVGFAIGVKDVWTRMFTADPAILKLTSIALPIIGLSELGNCLQTVASGVLCGIGSPAKVAKVNFGALYVVGMTLAGCLAFPAGMGFLGIWFGLLIGQVCNAAVMIYAVATTDWDAQAGRAAVAVASAATESSTRSRVTQSHYLIIRTVPDN